MRCLVITNNPMVYERNAAAEGAEYVVNPVKDGALGVFTSARDRIHMGHKLLTHPLCGSVKPNESPYKTVLLTQEAHSLDQRSLELIEEAIQTARKLADGRRRDWTEKVLNDLQLIDYSLIFNQH